MINNINIIYPKTCYTKNYKNVPQAPSFTGNPIMPSAEKSARKIEFFFRRLINIIGDRFETAEMKKLIQEFEDIDVNSEVFIDKLMLAGRKFGSKREVEVNIESGVLERIASSGKPNIFIMNHDNQKADPEMLAIFNTLLCQEYKNQGMAKSFPRPKIILNEDILLSMNPQKRKVFENIGAVGIDADLYSSDEAKNARALLPLLRGFLRDKVNIFIFPEGKLSVNKNLPLKEKFQIGAAEMINKLVSKKEEVQVVPIGFAYNKGSKNNLSSMYIGEPVVFKTSGSFVTGSKGNIDSPFSSEHYKRFFLSGNSEEKVITDKGVPVEAKNVSPYISAILCENLNICKKEAKNILPSASLNEKVIIV